MRRKRAGCDSTSGRYQQPASRQLSAGKLRPRAESDPQRRWPGPRGFRAPTTVLRPCGRIWGGVGSPGRSPDPLPAPPALTQAQTHLGSDAASPRHLQRGSIPGRRRRAPCRARAAPTSRPEPRAPGARPASLPVIPRAARPRENPGASFTSWAGPTGWTALQRPARLIHSVGPTHLRRPRMPASARPPTPLAHPTPGMPILQMETEA
ncbi:unnamed protein product [Rangifer tarandus platyrhynchus]|uniref:Uncharacterized protein n=2 Tax=Rangifer tarandus platyrhynchus TaxID=3082113 RepID=A0ABN8YXM1_RANTA|nr:unnamed protein product [Rangifer tarandus platyrhynchus]CAI9702807.1 unnamed protein product [Rangifer tarandus platyrhynchus]